MGFTNELSVVFQLIEMKKTLALFDFDHTLYQNDSLIDFTRISCGRLHFYFGLFVLLPDLIGLKLGLRNNQKVKIKFLKYFFQSKHIDDFQQKAQYFSKTKIPQKLNAHIFQAFLNHVAQNHEVYIVTASCPDWIEPWSDSYGVKTIGTKLEVIDQKITGNILTKNCYGIEKVNRIKELINLNDYNTIKVYGSGTGDKEMLQLSKE